MSSTITLNKTFEIEFEDNTTINVMVCVEASTEDDDFQGSRQIKIVNYDNVLDPIQSLLAQMLCEVEEEDAEDEDAEDSIN